MYCSNCGKQLSEGARFCNVCGAEQSPDQSAAPAAVPRPETRKAAAAPAAKQKEKFYDKAWFWLLCMAGLLIWGFYPMLFGKEEPAAEPLSLPEKAPLEELVPEGVPILDGGGYLLGSDTEEGTAAYDAQYAVFREQLDAAIREQQPQVCIVSALPLNYDTLGEAYGYPYFWLKSMSLQQGTALWKGETEIYRLYSFTYLETPDRIPAMQAQVDAARERYLSLIPAGADPWTAARIVHDEMVRSITYDQTKSLPHCHDIYGALVENTAVCQGYAYAFSYIMSEWLLRSGSRSPLVTEDANFYRAYISEDHAWNDSWITDAGDGMIDVTWDDPDMTDAYGEPYILYVYFGLTGEEIEAVDHHEFAGTNRPPITDFFLGEYGNYYKHEGCYLSSFDLNAITSVFAGQYGAGKNVLSVRFETQEDYDRIKTWIDSNPQEGQDVLSQIGYYGRSAYLAKDECRVFNILLNFPET